MLEIDFSDVKKSGFALRQAIALASRLNKEIRIVNFRAKEKNPGLRWRDLLYAKVLANLAGAECDLNKNALSFEIKPGKIIKGNKVIRVKNKISISELIMPAFMISYDNTKRLRFIGTTDIDSLIVPEQIKYSFFYYLGKLGFKANFEIISKGFEEEGSLAFNINNKKFNIKNFFVKDRGYLDTIKADIYSCGYNAYVNDEIFISARRRIRKEFQDLPVSIISNFYFESKTKNKGASIALLAFYENAVFTAAVSSSKKPILQVGKEAADKLIAFMQKDFHMDAKTLAYMLPFFCIASGSIKLTTNRITDRLLSSIKLCKAICDREIDYSIKEKYVSIK